MTPLKTFALEAKIYQLRYLFIIIVLFFISLGLIGLMFDLHSGFWMGLIVAALVLMFYAIWGEKLILIFSKARYVTDDEFLINQVKNFCSHCEIPEVKVYWSNVFVNNLYYTNSYFGKPALIIGRNLYQNFSRNELNSLIYASLLKLKLSESKHRTMTSLIFLTLYSPVYLIRSFFKKPTAVAAFNLYLYPAFFLMAKFYEKRNFVLAFDQRVAQHQGLKKDYISAIFKVNQLPTCLESSIGHLLMSELTHVKNQTSEIVSHILIDSLSVEERVKYLK